MKNFNVLLISVLISIASLNVYCQDFEFLTSKKPSLIIFYADWCSPCTKMKDFLLDNPTIDVVELVEQYDIKMYDFDLSKEIVNQYKVSTIPTIVVLKNEKEIGRIVGFHPTKLKNFLTQYK